MTPPVQQLLAGFIAGDADLSSTESGITQVCIRVGVAHGRREPDGTFIRLDNWFHDLVIFGGTAERATLFRKGNHFIAHGYVDPTSAEPPARPVERAVSVARRISPDLLGTADDVTHPLTTTRRGEALAPEGTANGRPSVEQKAPPTSPLAANRPVSLRSDASPVPGIGL